LHPGLPAQTIHSFFYKLVEVTKDKAGRQDLRFDRSHHRDELAGKLALIDEVSMLNAELANDLLRTGAKIIATGDPGQLPPVIGQAYFLHPDYTLTEIHRQALDSAIIRQAHRVRAGKPYQSDGAAFRVARDGTDADLLTADTILCWTNKTRHAVNDKIRRLRGFWQPYPQVGEPLMCLKNANELGIFNGGIYRLLMPFEQGDRDMVIDRDGDPVCVRDVTFARTASTLPEHIEATTSFDFGYTLTVHKSQGSEWNYVILIDEYRKSEDREKWLYTAITRAAERILVVK
jgi:exodeoxyribonuclease V